MRSVWFFILRLSRCSMWTRKTVISVDTWRSKVLRKSFQHWRHSLTAKSSRKNIPFWLANGMLMRMLTRNTGFVSLSLKLLPYIVRRWYYICIYFSQSHCRVNLSRSANMPKRSIPIHLITRHWKEQILYLWGGRSTFWYLIIRSKISMVPPLQDFTIFASRNPPPR